MNRKNIFSLLLISLLAIFIIGCNTNDSLDSDKENDAEETSENTESNFPLEVTDNTGNKITIEEEPTEIISVMPSNTEILFELGLGDKVIAVTENDAYPEEVLELDTVGDFELNVEKIISLDPDLVLAHESSVESSFDAYEQIQDAGINVYFVADAQTIDETYDTIIEVGNVTGANEAAEQIVQEMKDGFAEIDAIADEISADDQKTVLFEISPEPEIYTGGQGTFFDELIKRVGAKNAAGELDG